MWLSEIGSNSSFAVAHSASRKLEVEVKRGDDIRSVGDRRSGFGR